MPLGNPKLIPYMSYSSRDILDSGSADVVKFKIVKFAIVIYLIQKLPLFNEP